MAEPNLSDLQRSRIERNRQRALMLRNARLSSRPYPETSQRQGTGGGESSSTSRPFDTGGGFLLEPEESEEAFGAPKQVIEEPGPILGADQRRCLECGKGFSESFLFSSFDAVVCDKCSATIPGNNSAVPGKHSTLVENETKFLQQNLHDVRIESDYGYGFLDGTEEQKEEFLEQFTTLNCTRFVRCMTPGVKAGSQNVRLVFEQKSGNLPISCLSHPFSMISMERRNCLHGPLADSRGGKNQKPQNMSGHDYLAGSGGNIKVKRTRKVGCPATLQVRAIRMYTDYVLALSECSSKKGLTKAKAKILEQLDHDREMGKHQNTITRYYFKLPLSTSHKGHSVGNRETVGHSIHPKIAAKIKELVSENITSPDVVRKCLEQYTEKELFEGAAVQQKPRRFNRRYYPSSQDLRSHIARAISASDDQESLEEKADLVSDRQRSRIKRNKSRALKLRKARLTSRPYPETSRHQEAGGGESSSTPRPVDTDSGFLLEPEESEELSTAPEHIIEEPEPISGADQHRCLECGKGFPESFLLNSLDAVVCDKCRLHPDDNSALPSEHLSLTENEFKFLQQNLCNVSIESDYGYGFLNGTEEQKEELLKQFTALNCTRFVRSMTARVKAGSQNVRPIFEQKCGNLPISCLSHPFSMISMERRNCLHGPLADSRGGKNQKPQNMSGHDYLAGSGGNIKVKRTKKLDCPATLQVRAIRMYTDYVLALNECSSKKGLTKAKAKILEQLYHDREMGKHQNTITRYYFKLPLSTSHKGHPVGDRETVGHSIHPKIAAKIPELVSENITSPDVVRKCLEQYTEKELFGGAAAKQKPRRSNRRFYPSSQDLRSHIARAISASDDQESLM